VFEAVFQILAEEFGTAVLDPFVRPGALEPALGRDHQSWIGVQRLGNELFGDEGSVGVGGVEEVDPQLHGALQHAHGLFGVLGRAPDALAGEPHRAEPHAVDGQVAAQCDGSCGSGRHAAAGVNAGHEQFLSCGT